MDDPLQPQQPASQVPQEPSTGTIPPDSVAEAPKNGSKRFLIIAVVVALLAGGGYGAFALMGKDQVTQEKVKIGMLGPLSGDAAAYGYAALKGAQLAKKDLNAKNIEFVQEDSKCDAEVSPEAIKKLIAKKVVAIIGDTCSGASLASLPEADKNKIVMISPSSSSSALSIENDYFFRVVPPDDKQGKFLAKLLADKGIKKAAIFYSDEAYGQGLSKIFTENYEKLGGAVVASKGLPRDTIDASTAVSQINAASPEAVVILNNSTSSSIAFMKQFREAGGTVDFFGSDGLYDNSLLTSGGAAAEGLTATIFSSGTKEFRSSFIAEYGVEVPINAAAEAYDAFHALYRVIEKGATTGEAVAKALPTVDFKGVSARIKFDKYGDIAGDYTYQVVKIQSGKFVQQ